MDLLNPPKEVSHTLGSTIEHLLNHDQAVERVAERLTPPLMLTGFHDRAYDEWNGVT